MRTRITITGIVLLGAGALSLAQWQQFPQYDQRVGPVYPARPYSFQERHDYEPYHFDWQRGAWEGPVPYGGAPGNGYQYTYSNGSWTYAPAPPGSQGSATIPNPPQANSGGAPAGASANSSPGKPAPDDQLWTYSTTQPAAAPQPDMKFTGKIVAIKAIDLSGEPAPHLLLHLRSDNGAAGSVDVGTKIELPPGADGDITAVGKMGDINGSPVIFADQLVIGKATISIQR